MTGSAATSIFLVLCAVVPQEPPSFSSHVENVYVDTFVTHKGEPLLGLEAENFEIMEEMRTRYLLTFEPMGVEQRGEHRLEVRLRGAKGKVRARRSYYLTPSR